MDTAIVWKEFKDDLFGFIRKRVNNPEDARDILQDIFLKIHSKSASLKDSKSLTSWIYQITRNTIIDYYRSKKPHPDPEELQVEDEIPEEFDKQFYKCLNSHISALPEAYQEAFRRIEIDGISQKEYAEEIGISYSGAKSRYQRAKKQLKELFVECCAVETDRYGNVLNSDIEKCKC